MRSRLLGIVVVVGIAVIALSSAAVADPYPPANQGSAGTAPVGGTFSVSSDGWAPGSQVEVTLLSTPVVLGTLTADSTGHVEGTFPVPAGTTPGAHTVQVDGHDPSGAPRTVTFALTVTPSSAGTAPALAFTGGSSRWPAVLGFAAVSVGALLIFASRKRRSSVSSS